MTESYPVERASWNQLFAHPRLRVWGWYLSLDFDPHFAQPLYYLLKIWTGCTEHLQNGLLVVNIIRVVWNYIIYIPRASFRCGYIIQYRRPISLLGWRTKKYASTGRQWSQL